MVYRQASELDFAVEDLPALDPPRNVLFTRPDYFAVEYAINPHMEGNIGAVDREESLHEWSTIVRLYRALGTDVTEIPGVEGLPDMLFCANQTLPFVRPGTHERGVILSRMHAPQRAPEVEHYARFFREKGYEVISLPDSVSEFEGMGDALWQPGRYLLWGGHGLRSNLSAYEAISGLLDVRVIALHLSDPDFYHLDTCLCPLDEATVLIYPGAFDRDGVELIEAVFSRVVSAPEDEARNLFACNAHCPDGHNVILQAGCSRTIARLRDEGFNPIEVRTEEFLKAGGSVFCMKQMFW